MSATGQRPICQDTGIVNVFLKIGMDCRLEASAAAWKTRSTKACAAPTCTRTTRCAPRSWPIPHFARKNTNDNAPAVVNVELVPGNKVDVTVAAKGGGSENKSKMMMLNPSDSIVDWVLKTVPTMGAGWCPPGMLGIGIGGTAEKSVLLAKEALMEDIDMYELQAKAAAARSCRRSRRCGWSCTRRSTRWASARRAWAA
jgi:fumarate hydratase class I